MNELIITLYTKEGCHLCDQVKEKLVTLQAAYPHQLQEVDITQDHELFMKYRYMIPVLDIGAQQLRAPITWGDLRTALQEK